MPLVVHCHQKSTEILKGTVITLFIAASWDAYIHDDDVILDFLTDHSSISPAYVNIQLLEEPAVVLPAFQTVDIHFEFVSVIQISSDAAPAA